MTTEDQFLPDTLGAEPVFYRVQIRWLHLSSFHTGKDNNGQCRLFVVVPGHVESRLATQSPPHWCWLAGQFTLVVQCLAARRWRSVEAAQMTDAEIFDREMKPFGGRLDRRIPAGTPAESLHTKIEQVANAMILSARSHVPRLPEIHFDFVHNGKINAYAFKSEGRYFVGVTTGTLYLLQVVLSRMFAERGLFPTYGNPDDEAYELPPLKGYVPHAQKMCDAGLRPVLPRTLARFQCSGYFFFNAFLFLLGHEIAHIRAATLTILKQKPDRHLWPSDRRRERPDA